MKTLYLIRHAKSSWDFPKLSDHQRPLSLRGEEDAQIMSAELFKTNFKWPKVYYSSAQRAKLTIQALKDNWPDDQTKPDNIQAMDDLYTFSSEDIWQFVTELDQDLDSVLLVGHNPAFTDFINQASETVLDNLPTCAYAELQTKKNDWQLLKNKDFQLKTLLKPKMFKQ